MRHEFSPDQPWDPADHAVIADLRRVLEHQDPMPSGLVDRALFALTLEGLHAEVAELRRLATPVLSVRGEPEPDRARTITFSTEALTAMVTLAPDRGAVRIDGWIAPPATFAIEVHRPHGVVSVRSDADGRFVVDGLKPGPASLVFRADGGQGPVVSTPVVEI